MVEISLVLVTRQGTWGGKSEVQGQQATVATHNNKVIFSLYDTLGLFVIPLPNNDTT